MKIVPFEKLAQEQWDEACDASTEAWLYHRAAWIAMEGQRFAAENISFGVLEGDRLIGLQPLYLSELGLGSFAERLLNSGIHRHTGLAIIDAADSATRNATQRAAMQRIADTAAEVNADRIQLNSQNLAPRNRGIEREEIPFWVRTDGFQLGLNFAASGILPVPGMTTCCADQIVELAPPVVDLFSRLDESCRRAVRKAEAAGVQFGIGTDRSSVGTYFQLAQLSALRTGEALPPFDYYTEVWDRLAPSNRCAILFASHAGREVAGLFLTLDKRAASFFAGVSDPAALSLRVNDFLHWNAIAWLKQRDIACYRLGPAFPELPDDWPIVRISRFKRKFGGRSVSIIQGSFFRHPEKYLAQGLVHLQARIKRPESA